MNETKTCSRCKLEKDIGKFYSNSVMKDGVDYYCKKCRRFLADESMNRQTKVCETPRCGRLVYAKGSCRRCYEYARRTGIRPTIKLTVEDVVDSIDRILSGTNITKEAVRLDVSPTTLRDAIRADRPKWKRVRNVVDSDVLEKVNTTIEERVFTKAKKVTQHEVDEIRRRFHENDERMIDIAVDFDLSVSGVSRIVNGSRWSEDDDDVETFE